MSNEFSSSDLTAGQLNAIVKKLGGRDGALKFLRDDVIIKASNLLRVAEVAVSATNRFVASDHIKAANVGWMSDNFKRLFLNKVEENIPDAELVVSELKKASLDAPIMTELGERKKIALAHFFELLEKQSKGQAGLLLTNGYAIIGYIQDEEENFWAVNAHWRSDYRYWDVYAISVGCLDEWNAGRQVLSCK